VPENESPSLFWGTSSASSAAHNDQLLRLVCEGAIRVLLDSAQVDAVVVGIIPLTPGLKTLPSEINHSDSLAQRLPRLANGALKPLIMVVDSGALYDAFARSLREAGVPVFRSADQAIRSLGRYLCHRVGRPRTATHVKPEPVASTAMG